MNQQYELLAVIDPDMDEATVTSSVEKAISELKITQGKKDVWGLRTLAYPINSKNRGRYILYELSTSEGASIQELNRELLIIDGVIRFNLVKQAKKGKGGK
ncbi:30S ribosomal protein S6 [candidate division WWE3 bacterium]|nr:30S ribosomal protein S6 [candidate division WWE3 bacterium]